MDLVDFKSDLSDLVSSQIKYTSVGLVTHDT